MARPQLGALPADPTPIAFGDTASKGAAGDNAALATHRHAAPANPLGTAWEVVSNNLRPKADESYDLGTSSLKPDFVYGRVHVAQGDESPGAAYIGQTSGVINGATAGAILFRGNGYEMAGVSVTADGQAPASGDSPGMLNLSTTPDGSATAAVKWQITSSGVLQPFLDSNYDIGTDLVRPANIYADDIDVQSTVVAGASVTTPYVNSPATNVFMYSTFQ